MHFPDKLLFAIYGVALLACVYAAYNFGENYTSSPTDEGAVAMAVVNASGDYGIAEKGGSCSGSMRLCV